MGAGVPDTVENPRGLAQIEADQRIREYGANTTSIDHDPLRRRVLAKFSSPIAWMLEAAIIVEFAAGSRTEGVMTAALLAFNAIIGIIQENRAGAAVAALKRRLAVTAVVRRDGQWVKRAAAEIVPGDVVRVGLGAMVPADANIVSGAVLVDEAVLTGESVPREAAARDTIFAGAIVRRGEAVARVTATGSRTFFGRTAELVRTAGHVSTEQIAVVAVTRNLAVMNGAVAAIIIVYGYFVGLHQATLAQLGLAALLGAIPVALPATFTLSAAFAAQALAKKGVLLTRLSAAHEAAAMDVLCADKTGTLTRNVLEVTDVAPMPGFDADEVVQAAAMASSEADEDPLDAAIHRAWARPVSWNAVDRFVPFDPETKRAEVFFRDGSGEPRRAVKGALEALASISAVPSAAWERAEALASTGRRVIAVALGPPEALRLAGLIAISDPPRQDSRPLVAELARSGVRTIMVTGDSPATGAAVAQAVGIVGRVAPSAHGPVPEGAERFGVFARVTPEGKFRLVQSLQADGHVVGMFGDGTNDAPALRQAQIGIAVFNATDAAKASAGMVLTQPGLQGVVAAVCEGRIGFERVLTYTLNMLVKKTEIVLFLAIGLVLTGRPVLTPGLMVLLFLSNDLLSMSLTTDRASPGAAPSVWRISKITLAALLMGALKLAFSIAVLLAVRAHFRLDDATTRRLAFIVLVFGNQAVLYALRERRRMWASRPGRLVVAASLVDIGVASLLAASGTLMVPLSPQALIWVAGGAIFLALALDELKLLITARIDIGRWPGAFTRRDAGRP